MSKYTKEDYEKQLEVLRERYSSVAGEIDSLRKEAELLSTERNTITEKLIKLRQEGIGRLKSGGNNGR